MLTCINFANTGAGVKEPVKVATISGRNLYFIFWAYLEGTVSRRREVYALQRKVIGKEQMYMNPEQHRQ